LAIGFIIILAGLIGVIISNSYLLQKVDINQAEKISERYLASLNSPDLAIDEIMEFEQNFYVIYYEKSTNIGAFEMLIDKNNGRIFPEYGPNMMWNTKYGHGGMMGGQFQPPQEEEIMEEREAITIAQKFLDEVYPESEAEDPHPFYGYYTIHTTKNGGIFGMLSVNMNDGVVWYHNWHGDYIRSLEIH
jgi:hypothetical protein